MSSQESRAGMGPLAGTYVRCWKDEPQMYTNCESGHASKILIQTKGLHKT
jgi:hypothetical protein